MNATAPNYAGLLTLLPRLKRFPDATGETCLTPAEATEIRSLGFEAEAGKWNIPYVPFEFVRDTVFEWTSRQRRAIRCGDLRQGVPQEGEIDRDDVEQPQQVSGAAGLPQLQQRLLEAVVRGGSGIPKRRLQQKFWRDGAGEFNAGLSKLLRSGFLRAKGKIILLTSKHLPPCQESSRPSPASL